MRHFHFSSLRFLFALFFIFAGSFPISDRPAFRAAASETESAESAEPTEPAEPPQAELDAKLIADLNEACSKAADVFSTELMVQSADNLKSRARIEMKNLIYSLSRSPEKEKGNALIKDMQLDELRQTLSVQETDTAVVKEAFSRLNSNDEELERSDFARLRNILDDYLTALDRNSQGNIREDFAYNCSALPEDVQEYLDNPASPDAPGRIAAALDFMDECQSDSTHIRDITNLLRNRFAQPNLLVSVGGKVIFPNKPFEFTEQTVVKEIIRDVPTYGTGTVEGTVTPSFVANEKKAQFQLAFNAVVRTRNRADSTNSPISVTVFTSNVGTVAINKYIYFDEKGISLGNYSAAARLGPPKVTGVFTQRGQVFSGIVYNQVLSETSKSKAEAEQLLKMRTVQQFDKRLSEITKNNDRVAQVWDLLEKYDYLPEVKTRTTANMLECRALIGSRRQVSAAAPPARQLGPHDLVVRMHQSALNNPLHELLAGHTISEKEVKSWVRENLPEVDVDQLAARAEEAAKQHAGESSEISEEESELEMESISISFCEVLPAYVTLTDGVFGLHLRVDAFEQKGKDFPGLDIDIEYEPQQRDGVWVLTRKDFEAWPPELDRNATVPVRYQVIRRQIRNRLGAALPEEIPLSAIPLYDVNMVTDQKPAETPLTTDATATDADAEETAPAPETTHASSIRGNLAVSEIDIQDGWLLIGADYQPAE